MNNNNLDTATIAADIAQRCQQARQTKDGWQACCPAHNDANPSLSITANHERVLLKCHAGCSFNAIVEALGMTSADLRVTTHANDYTAPQSQRRITKVYDYFDAKGTLVHQTLRYEPKDFRQRRPDPDKPGEYIWSLKGIETVLYNLPAVLQAKADGQSIYLTEGEKDASTLTVMGFTTTCNPMGAGKWEDSYTSSLTGADVVLFPDNDVAGKKHAELVQSKLTGHVKTLRMATVPAPHKDVSDWVQAGATRADVAALVASAPALADAPSMKPLAASMVSFAELLKLQIPERELYQDCLRERSLAMVYGPRGIGKTMHLLGWSIALASGTPFLNWATHRQVGVLYVDGEMTLADLRERALGLASDGMPDQLFLLPSELVYEHSFRNLTLTTTDDQKAVEAMLEAHPSIKVLVLDNISCLFPGIDENDKKAWEPIAAWFTRLRHKGLTIIVGHHAGKDGKQRGTSGREDNLDTVIALSLPDNYNPEEGCHYHLRFEKHRGLKGNVVQPLDVRLEEMPDATTTWTYALLETSKTERIIAMLNDGVPPRSIAEEVHANLSLVYRVKKQQGL